MDAKGFSELQGVYTMRFRCYAGGPEHELYEVSTGLGWAPGCKHCAADPEASCPFRWQPCFHRVGPCCMLSPTARPHVYLPYFRCGQDVFSLKWAGRDADGTDRFEGERGCRVSLSRSGELRVFFRDVRDDLFGSSGTDEYRLGPRCGALARRMLMLASGQAPEPLGSEQEE